MHIVSLIAVVATVALVGATSTQARAPKKTEPAPVFDAIKTIPEGATIEYHVKDQMVQQLQIAPGIYQISIKKLR